MGMFAFNRSRRLQSEKAVSDKAETDKETDKETTEKPKKAVKVKKDGESATSTATN